MKINKKKSRKGALTFLLIIFLISLGLNLYYFYQLNEDRRSKLVINLKDRIKYGVYCVGEQKPDVCYWFDYSGVIFKEATTIIDLVSLKVNEVSNFQPRIGQQFLDEDLFTNLRWIMEFLKQDNLEVNSVVLQRNDQELIVNTKEGVKILFSLRFDPRDNIKGLLAFIRKVKTLNEFKQINLKTENKIFYK